MYSKISAFIYFKLLGWKFKGKYPHHLKKHLIIVIPHTSNWDFPLGLLVRSISKAKAKFIGKSSLFKPPFGFLFKALGGLPVDRSKSQNFVDAAANLFNEKEELGIVLAPEGTRSRVDRLKTGFYYIAHKANVPIVMIKFDYKTKTVTFGDHFFASGDYDKDFHYLEEFFSGIEGKNPGQGYFYRDQEDK